LLMLASSAEYINPLHLAAVSAEWRRATDNPWVIDGTLVYVDDVDRHYERAKAAGARIIREIESAEYGRLYAAADPEGHRWMFMQKPS